MAPKDYFERDASQMAVIGKKGQQELKQTRVHISGLGGLGNLVALFLSALGVGYISANAPQRLERENLGRFVCGDESGIGQAKVKAAAKYFRRNSHLGFDPIGAPSESPSLVRASRRIMLLWNPSTEHSGQNAWMPTASPR
jgi:molybdopterin/thiamine biosynthesis adenylyltransferase